MWRRASGLISCRQGDHTAAVAMETTPSWPKKWKLKVKLKVLNWSTTKLSDWTIHAVSLHVLPWSFAAVRQEALLTVFSITCFSVHKYNLNINLYILYGWRVLTTSCFCGQILRGPAPPRLWLAEGFIDVKGRGLLLFFWDRFYCSTCQILENIKEKIFFMDMMSAVFIYVVFWWYF